MQEALAEHVGRQCTDGEHDERRGDDADAGPWLPEQPLAEAARQPIGEAEDPDEGHDAHDERDRGAEAGDETAPEPGDHQSFPIPSAARIATPARMRYQAN